MSPADKLEALRSDLQDAMNMGTAIGLMMTGEPDCSQSGLWSAVETINKYGLDTVQGVIWRIKALEDELRRPDPSDGPKTSIDNAAEPSQLNQLA